MTGKHSTPHPTTFDSIRHVDDEGNEYWRARQLAQVLEYSEYRHFLPVIERAKIACENSDERVDDHFEDVLGMVAIGSGAQRPVEDVHLSRYACYLIVQNGDPSKPVIAHGQTYFALQTRRQELEDDRKFAQLSEDDKRLAIRNELAAHNKYLAAAAKEAGVDSPLDYAIFQDHGYKGLYGGLGAKDIHTRKGLKKRNWPPTCSAPPRPKRSCAAIRYRERHRPIAPTSRLDRRSARPSRNSAAPCRSTCPRPRAASGSSRRPRKSN